MMSRAVWNAGTHAVHSRGKDCIVHKTKEIKHVLRAKGNFPTTLARSQRAHMLIKACLVSVPPRHRASLDFKQKKSLDKERSTFRLQAEGHEIKYQL